MDMTLMSAGPVETSIADQHAELAGLRDHYPNVVIPFAAVDPRHPGIVETTIRLLEDEGFRGIKLYPPTGYHPYDSRLHDLYAYANQHNLPLITHCSRPASVQYRGTPTAQMQQNPENNNQPLNLGRKELLTYFTRPDAYLPLLRNYPDIKVCLAHFGGEGDWRRYLDHPWNPAAGMTDGSWLAVILDLIRSGDYPNLRTDISYTLFADDEYVYVLKTLLSNEQVRARVLFGSDFYVVENARLEERRRSVKIRGVLGEELFDTIARKNPEDFLATPP
jgi:predicted TIM-barrel fold metal-dependent hydrolase